MRKLGIGLLCAVVTVIAQAHAAEIVVFCPGAVEPVVCNLAGDII